MSIEGQTSNHPTSNQRRGNRYRLCVRGPSAPVEYYLTLSPGRNVVGSDPSANFYLNDPFLSHNHFVITCTQRPDGQMLCQLTVLESQNGTLYNNNSLIPGLQLPLREADVIQAGAHTFIFQAVASSDERPADMLAVLEHATTAQAMAKVPFYLDQIPPGLAWHSLRLMQFLPEIYQPALPEQYNRGERYFLPNREPESFLTRFLALFESVFLPMEWQVDHFDFYLDIRTTPTEFLVWFERWFGHSFADLFAIQPPVEMEVLVGGMELDGVESGEPKIKQRLDRLVYELYALRGTSWAIRFALQTYLGTSVGVEIQEANERHAFSVKLNNLPNDRDAATMQAHIWRLINTFKPAHTICEKCEPFS